MENGSCVDVMGKECHDAFIASVRISNDYSGSGCPEVSSSLNVEQCQKKYDKAFIGSVSMSSSSLLTYSWHWSINALSSPWLRKY
jgi:hypothetical protein